MSPLAAVQRLTPKALRLICTLYDRFQALNLRQSMPALGRQREYAAFGCSRSASIVSWSLVSTRE
jgi:hypothetical protein